MALAADDVWAVGQAGTILHWDGGSWARVPSGFHNNVHAIWGDAATGRIWLVGTDGAIVSCQ